MRQPMVTEAALRKELLLGLALGLDTLESGSLMGTFYVLSQVRGRLEHLRALRTRVRPQVTVPVLDMLRHLGLGCECFSAGVTCEAVAFPIRRGSIVVVVIHDGK